MKIAAKFKNRLVAAMGSYLILAIIAAVELDGFLRGIVLVFLALLAIKTLAHSNEAGME